MTALKIILGILAVVFGLVVILFAVALVYNRLSLPEERMRYNPLWLFPAIIYESLLISIYVPFFFFGFISTKRKYRPSPKPPTILLHGYGVNKLCFAYLYLRLRSFGDTSVIPINIGPLFTSIEKQAENFSKKVEAILDASETEKVNIIAHSQGGLISRYYLQFLQGDKKVDRLVTIGTPHHGTMIAHLGVGKNAHEMRPGSNFLQKLNHNPDLGKTSLLSIYSPADTFIWPAHSPAPPRGSSYITIPLGHMSLLFSARVLQVAKKFLDSSTGQAHGR
ncbi:MAG: alpha/beta fold hydrolase [Firmicutes bacterium]|jgi:pimeloyl-ACP methyl ester carboxylesterase|nr:alpha/beta fold hydrolase [Bacillota bacterium]